MSTPDRADIDWDVVMAKMVGRTKAYLDEKLALIIEHLEDVERRPVLTDCGIWRSGIPYTRGACVSDRGSLWIAQQPTTSRPGSNGE